MLNLKASVSTADSTTARASSSKISTKELVQLSLFTAIIFIMGITPLGYLPIGIFKVVTVHIPVIIGSIILGPKYGSFLGFVFGLTSLITAHINVGPVAFMFSPFLSGNILSAVVCFVPRILVGIVPYYIYNIFRKIFKNRNEIALSLAGIVGSFTNTVFVLGFIYTFFKDSYAEVWGTTPELLLGVMFSNLALSSLVEAITASILTVAITKVLLKFVKL
ncbi:MAG: ECF transporter S component [bacterium]